MKLSTLWMIMVALQFTLMAFGNIAYEDTALFTFILSPTDWSGTALLFSFVGIAAALAGIALVGSVIFGKTDTLVFAGVVSSFVSFCIPIGSLWQVIYREIGIFGVESVQGITMSAYAASALVAPLAIISIVTILNWWRTTGEG